MATNFVLSIDIANSFAWTIGSISATLFDATVGIVGRPRQSEYASRARARRTDWQSTRRRASSNLGQEPFSDSEVSVTDMTDVLNGVVEYLTAGGAEVTTRFVDPAPNNAFVRYRFNDSAYIIGVTDDAEHTLRNWSEKELSDFLHSYRIVTASEDLTDDEFFLIHTSGGAPPLGTTFMDRGIVASVEAKAGFGIR